MKAVIVFVATNVLFVGFLFFNRDQTQTNTVQNTPTPSATFINEKVDIKASFKITTYGTFRIFTDPKYHHQSEDVFIELADPSIDKLKIVIKF